MTFYLAPIVEGHSEAQGCVERLLQRIWNELFMAEILLQVLEPIRGNRASLINANRSDLGDKIGQAYAKLNARLRRDPNGRGALLILLDAEDDCPAELGPRLLNMAQYHRSDIDIVCVLAKRMFENWIVAGASSLAGVNGLPSHLEVPHHCEDCSGSKWLEEQIRSVRSNRAYKKSVDASQFVQKMDLNHCRNNSPSFARLCKSLRQRLSSSSAE